MIINEVWMRANGSGMDPTDQDCMDGYNFYVENVGSVLGPSHSMVDGLARCDELFHQATGDYKVSIGKWVQWTKRKTKESVGLETGQEAKLVKEYMIITADGRKEYKSLSAATKKAQELNVIVQKKIEDGSVTRLVREGNYIRVESATKAEAEAAKADAENEKQYIEKPVKPFKKIKMYQKLLDKEGFWCWVPIDYTQ